MKNILFLLITILISSTLLGQDKEGVIINSETKEPIPYVNIGIINKNKGTVSNTKGEFIFKYLNELMKDTIRISSIGYKVKQLTAFEFLKKLSLKHTIELDPKTIELEEIIITSKKNSKLKTIGNIIDRKRDLQLGFSNSFLGNEIGIKIKTNQKIHIKEFNTFITENTEDMLFRLNFYDIKNDKPNKKIVLKNIIFSFNNKIGKFTLDLSEYQIFIEKDFYFSIEIVESHMNNRLSFSSNLKKRVKCLIRKSSQDKWYPFGNIAVGFYLTIVSN